jgi:predicted GNAT family N-acyltransferase
VAQQFSDVDLSVGSKADARAARIGSYWVASVYQRRGIGRRLVATFIDGVGEEVTVVLHATAGAGPFYAQIGIEPWSDVFRRPSLR